MTAPRELPREIAGGIWWLGGCLESAAFDEPVHFHTSVYLVVGAERTLLFDTGPPAGWPTLERDLEAILGGRGLDLVLPSHPEIPHAGCLNRVLDRYPQAQVVGDLRDYHLYFPDYAGRMHSLAHGSEIDLGGGHLVTLLDAVIEDLPNTTWAYEHRERVLFSVDALGYGHLPQTVDLPEEPLHRRGECALLSSELRQPPDLELATHLTQSSLYWSRYVDIAPYLERMERLFELYPARLIAPAHGSVVDDLEVVMPVIRQAHRRAFLGRGPGAGPA